MNHKILIVDDDATIIEALSIIMEMSGYTPISTTRGAKVLPLVKSLSPSLIILDIMLPDIDGREVSRLLKKNPLYRKIPIILISAHAEQHNLLTDSSAELFLEKPLDINRLLTAVQSLII